MFKAASFLKKKKKNCELIRFVSLFHPLLDSALGCSGVANDRTILTDTLNVWLQRAAQLSQISTATAEDLTSSITDDDVTNMFYFVCDFWTDSGVALGSALKELFLKVIALLTKIRSGDSLNRLLRVWTLKVMQFPRTMRVFYFTLEILVQHVGASYVLEISPTLIPEAFGYMSSNALANPAGKMLYGLFQSGGKEPGDSASQKADTVYSTAWIDRWTSATIDALYSTDAVRDAVVTYFLPHMFKHCPKFFDAMLAKLRDLNTHSTEQFIGVLKVGQDIGLFEAGSTTGSSHLVDLTILENLLCHSAMPLRIGALSLLVSSPQHSKPISEAVLQILERNFDCLLESDAGFRNQMMGLMRHFVTRIRAYSYGQARQLNKIRHWKQHIEKTGQQEKYISDVIDATKEEQQIEHSLAYLQKFCHSLLQYMQSQLLPGCPYHSLITSVSIIALLLRSGLDHCVEDKFLDKKQYLPFPFSVDVFTPTMCRLLVDNVANNYEDIRVACTHILQMAPPSVLAGHIDHLVLKAETMVRGMRGREGDAGARISQFVYTFKEAQDRKSALRYVSSIVDTLEAQAKMAHKDYARSVKEECIHGTFTSLHYIFEEMTFGDLDSEATEETADLVSRIIAVCESIWKIVEPILVQAAPEGSIIEENLDSRTTLSYAWRAIRESTALQQTFFDRLSSSDILPDGLILECGKIILHQLATVRHRGAFSSVYPTLIACCRRCYRRPNLRFKPGEWLTDNLELVQTRSQYITRRSGGLPYLVTAVLSANNTIQGEKFSGKFDENFTSHNDNLLMDTFNRLLHIAKTTVQHDEVMDLPQVHAFNCIRAIFTDTDLSSTCAPLVDDGLDLAISSFSSSVWSIRNCAVMLFTALQNRLFGGRKKVSSKLFFSKFKGVRRVLLENLQTAVKNIQANDQAEAYNETVFPTLAVLSRLQAVSDYSGLDEFRGLVMQCLENKVWKIREMAAKVLASMTTKQTSEQVCRDLLFHASLEDQNQLHGRLLAILEILNEYPINDTNAFDLALKSQSPDSESKDTNLFSVPFFALLARKFVPFLILNECNETALAFFRISKLVINSHALLDYCDVILAAEYSDGGSGLDSCGRTLRAEAAAYALKYKPSDDLISRLLFDSAYEVQLAVLDYIEKQSTTDTFGQVIASDLWQLFDSGSDWDQVRGPAVRLFGEMKSYSDISSDELKRYWEVLFASTASSSTDEIRESAIESLGMLTGLSNKKYPEMTGKWIDLICEQFDDAYPARLAALKSLTHYIAQVPQSDCRVQFALFFFLSDDDSDLRQLASKAVCEYLKIEPCIVSHCERALLHHILRLPGAVDQVLELLLGDLSIADQINVACEEDNILFSVEKQNLYRNDLQKLDQYKEFLSSHPLDDVQSKKLKCWLNEASISLKKLFGLKDTDGYLGWASNIDLFHVLYRIRAAFGVAENLGLSSEFDFREIRLQEEQYQYHGVLCI